MMDDLDWKTVFQPVDIRGTPQLLPEYALPPVEYELIADAAVYFDEMQTPPSSDGPHAGGASDADGTVSVSTTFFPDAALYSQLPDLILLPSDCVFFYVQTHRILSMSSNGFSGFLPVKNGNPTFTLDTTTCGQIPIISLPEPATVLNIVLHAVYDISFARYQPTLDALLAAVDALDRYGMSVEQHCIEGSLLFTLLLAQAPIAPIEVYAVAAHHGLQELAVRTSAHSLGYPLSTLSDAHACKMGAVYLKRLFFLHIGRVDALRRMILAPPYPHPPTPQCDFSAQKKLTRAWGLASAYIAWDARPDVPASQIESALRSLAEHLECEICRKALEERTKQLVVQWSIIKRTI
ncbi:hypothetical protein WOLCODRAFT_108268 [Wolfiporia cocos MD-104 SS10]|uniref:BTB domain-containing protein n=1 Tax=Wolfiporia cocos (strain MD-104) TaxID=742152 RepID=A0A2H3JJG2_WOLCO|nr:hypothetical protein WOLCODRAFT_108268 [Wolfiporia cocos MD-104 SS10]